MNYRNALFKISGHFIITISQWKEHKQIVPAVGTASKTADENGLSKNKTRDFPIVGIGASAGLEAMELF
jgi:hypothetical protein